MIIRLHTNQEEISFWVHFLQLIAEALLLQQPELNQSTYNCLDTSLNISSNLINIKLIQQLALYLHVKLTLILHPELYYKVIT